MRYDTCHQGSRYDARFRRSVSQDGDLTHYKVAPPPAKYAGFHDLLYLASLTTMLDYQFVYHYLVNGCRYTQCSDLTLNIFDLLGEKYREIREI